MKAQCSALRFLVEQWSESNSSDKICRPFSELNSGLLVSVFKGLHWCCKEDVAPDTACRKNGPEEVNGERAGRWDYEMTGNICQVMGFTPLSLILIGLCGE